MLREHTRQCVATMIAAVLLFLAVVPFVFPGERVSTDKPVNEGTAAIHEGYCHLSPASCGAGPAAFASDEALPLEPNAFRMALQATGVHPVEVWTPPETPPPRL